MALLHDRELLSVTEAARRGVSGLLADAESGKDIVVARHAKPVAVVVSMERFGELQALEEDLRDLAVVLAPVATDGGRRTTFDDVLTAFGTSRAELEELADE